MDQPDNWHLTGDIKHESGSGDPFAAAVRATRMPMVITDPARADNPIIYCNQAFQKLSGYERDEIIGRNCRFLQGPETDPEKVKSIREAIEAGEDIAIELLNYRKDGTTFWNALYLSPVRGEAGDIQFFFASQVDVTGRVEERTRIAKQKAEVEREVERRTNELQSALEAKTLLLHEVDHRVKNNLTMIGSLLRLQARKIGDPMVGAKLEAMLERVDALATVHRRLYQSEDISLFDVGTFTENLAADVVGGSGRSEITLHADVERIEIPSSKASALGLVLNEVVTNAIKHGFADGREGVLMVSAKADGNIARIAVRDVGPGLDGGMPGTGGLGATLIKRLSKQIGATVAFESLSPGTRVTITFPIDPQ